MRGAILAGVAVLALSGPAGSAPAVEQTKRFYDASDGSTVRSPRETLQHLRKETAVCADGTHSVAHSHRGACSSHGGVEQWQ